MFIARVFQLAALLASTASASPAPQLARQTSLYTVQYEEWTVLTLPIHCYGSPNATGHFDIGPCAELVEPGHGFRLTPQWPVDSNCTVRFWTGAGCTGFSSATYNITNNEESACILPFARFASPELIPYPLVSAQVICSEK
ncbi:hypothetical protein K488DRAFT_74058 [Vararia minispora EC-137]|uniref:Uncharacterized protein n=1 Tax=Vararia minispora EC-137 TaxID=1314806 RepID=A0ACB8Q8M8_9AGAM|nr:hypothetical protein K488DRAFT_74058 [Vararia minispora EC-137]